MNDESRDIGARLQVLEEFLHVAPPSPTPLYMATGCAIISLVTGVLMVIQRSLPATILTIVIVAFIVAAVYSVLIHQSATTKWRATLTTILSNYRQRMEFVANEVNRFVSCYDDQTREHYHSMTQTKIRTYFILQEVLQRLSSENNTLMHALETKDYGLMVEFSQTLLGPFIVRESPISAGEIVIARADLENFLDETSAELIESTKAHYRNSSTE